MERGLLAAVGGGIALFGGFFVAYFTGELFSKTSENTVGLNAGLVIFFGGVTFVGAYLVWRMVTAMTPAAAGATRPGVGGTPPPPPSAPESREPARPTSEPEREHVVLTLAERQHGRVTIPEVAARCNMTISEAKSELDRLVALQVAYMQVTSSGGLVYVFNGFLTDEDKAAAKDF